MLFNKTHSLGKKNAKIQSPQIDYNLVETFKSSVMFLKPSSMHVLSES